MNVHPDTVGTPTVAMIHATPAAIAPAVSAFAERFPEAHPWHLLDDRLAGDADAAGGLTPHLRRRMLTLIEHANEGAAHAVLLTCSMYAPVVELARELWDRPMMASDEAMHACLRRDRPARLVLLGSLRTAVSDAATRLRRELGGVDLVEVVGDGASAAARAGDDEALLASLLDAATPHAGEADAVALCQYSLAGVRDALAERLETRVYSPPHAAAGALRARLGVSATLPRRAHA